MKDGRRYKRSCYRSFNSVFRFYKPVLISSDNFWKKKVNLYNLNRILYALMLVVFFSCEKEAENAVLISGGLVSSKSEFLVIKNRDITNPKTIDTFYVNKKGEFKDTISVALGYYKIEADNLNFDIYLEPGFNLDLILDQEKSKVYFKGIGADENEYLFSRQKKRQALKHIDTYKNFVKLDEEEFLKMNDSIGGVYKKLLEDTPIKNIDFLHLERSFIALNMDYNLMSFEVDKKLLTDEKDYKVSINYPKPFSSIDINNETLLKLPFFIPFLANNHYYFLKDKSDLFVKGKFLKCKNCDIDVAYLKEIDKNITNQKIKNKVSYLIAKWHIIGVDSLDLFYKTFKAINTDAYYKKDIESTFNKLNKVKKIRSVVETKLINRNGDTTTLNQYNGKFLYVDIWASSCKPCLVEFPSFNKLADKYIRNITFVGINVWDSNKRWLDVLNKHELKGNQFQLIEENSTKVDFTKELEINSLPRYLLLDKYGSIIDFNEAAPSEERLQHKIDSLLSLRE